MPRRHILYTCVLGVLGGVFIGGWVFLSSTYGLGADYAGNQNVFRADRVYFETYSRELTSATQHMTEEGSQSGGPEAESTPVEPEVWAYTFAASIMMAGHLFFPGGPMGGLVYRAYMVGSEAARDAGLTFAFPERFCPAPDSPAITERDLLHRAWLIPIALTGFMSILDLVKRYSLGYLFFRLTSDIENLPFPMAPIAAQGALALAEADDTATAEETEEDEIGLIKGVKRKKKTTRWRVFSLGATIGVVFGMFQVGIPAITSLFL